MLPYKKFLWLNAEESFFYIRNLPHSSEIPFLSLVCHVYFKGVSAPFKCRINAFRLFCVKTTCPVCVCWSLFCSLTNMCFWLFFFTEAPLKKTLFLRCRLMMTLSRPPQKTKARTTAALSQVKVTLSSQRRKRWGADAVRSWQGLFIARISRMQAT